MATNSISAKVMTAASVTLAGPIRVYGVNTYTISSDFISWGEGHNYTISEIAEDFGARTAGVGDRVFACGADKISVYDFGLLFTVFTAMTSAQAELGSKFAVSETEVSREGVHALWIGNDVIIYSVSNNIILPVDNADMERICSGERLECSNFCTKDRFIIDRERVEIFIVTATKHELFCRTRISDGTQRSYPKHFAQPEDTDRDVLATWDIDSTLGRLIASTDRKPPTMSAFKNYKKRGMTEDVSVRHDLLVFPGTHYNGLETPEGVRQMLGHICYTDKDEVVIAVNHHAGLFVYSPCFPGDNFDGLLVDGSPDLQKFCEVSQECERIMRYAKTVINTPLTSAQLDVRVYNNIATALMEERLPRISFQAGLGKVIIPESVLESTFSAGFGADLFCIVPVGVVGEVVVCKTATGKLEAVYPRGWTTSEAFYDVTEVVSDVER